MEIEVWLAFVGASAALLIVPGPVVILLFSHTVLYGRAVSCAAIPGVVLGDLSAMTVSLAGAGAVLAASATLFTVLKICGAVYLVWLGVKVWYSDLATIEVRQDKTKENRWAIFRQAFLVTALNPKDIVFFVAFLPQFIDSGRPAFLQLAMIGATFILLVSVTTAAWILAAGCMRSGIQSTTLLKWFNRLGASSLIGAGAFAATMR